MEGGMKPLLSTLKEKRRYIAFEVFGNKKFSHQQLIEAINDTNLRYLGVVGAASAGLQHIREKWSEELQTGVIRVNHKFVDRAKSLMALTDRIDNTKVVVRSLRTSGTIKGLVKK